MISFNSSNLLIPQVQDIINGKGGGKPENAQAVGTNVSGLKKALEVASSFAASKLGVSPPAAV